MPRYFVGLDSYLTGEVLVDEPANPQELQIIETEQPLGGLVYQYRWDEATGQPVQDPDRTLPTGFGFPA